LNKKEQIFIDLTDMFENKDDGGIYYGIDTVCVGAAEESNL